MYKSHTWINKPNHFERFLYRALQRYLHVDPVLLALLLALAGYGLVILYSASDSNAGYILRQGTRLGFAFVLMFVLTQIPPWKYRQWAFWVFGIGIVLLIVVLIVGHIGKGAQRWFGFAGIHFQPSEIMKIAVPMVLARYLHDHPLPPSFKALLICGLFILIPAFLVSKQPDLSTASIICFSGLAVILLAGMRFKIIIGLGLLVGACTPIIWQFLHHYQKQRVLVFLNPQLDPLNSGYHIIQSKIAIGSGGIFGKGWLAGTQSHLQFLPEHTTDFIFAVAGEEFGLFGGIILLTLIVLIALRCLYISSRAQDTFSRLLAGSLTLTFLFSAFVNIGSVIGILPVAGLPLPLISYGGTSMMTMMASFGIIMAIHSHRKLVVR